MNAILQQVQHHAAVLPLALQAELLNYALYLEQKTQSLTPTMTKDTKEQQRKRLAEALEQLAALNPFSDIADPVGWQREQRQERPLPGRHDVD